MELGLGVLGLSPIAFWSLTPRELTYSSADQIADFGSTQSSVSIKVYQTNVVLGRGAPCAAVV